MRSPHSQAYQDLDSFWKLTHKFSIDPFSHDVNSSDFRNRDHISPRSVIRMNSTHTRSYDDSQRPLFGVNHGYKSQPSNQQKLIPFVSKLTLQQALPLIFSAFWNGANLYADVLGVHHSKKEAISSARLRLAYFRKGREVLAWPVEVDDEVTTLTYQGISGPGAASKMAIRSGVPITRKAKKRFQAICLAYDVLSDPHTRTEYDGWVQLQSRQPPSFAQNGSARSSTRLDTIIERINSVPKNQDVRRSHLSNSFSDSHLNSSELDFSSDILNSTDDRDLSRSFSTTSSGLDSILRPTTISKPRRAVTPSKIKWNEQVEELVIMDYDRRSEHLVEPKDRTDKKVKSKKSGNRSFDDDDDLWSSNHPFFPEQDMDLPFDETTCSFPSKRINKKNKSKKDSYRKHTNKVSHRRDTDDWWESEYDDHDELSSRDSEFSSDSGRSHFERGNAYEQCSIADEFEGKEDDCGVPLGFDFDVAAGFQVALSKYLGNVLSEMKSGLSELGKTFSDIDVHPTQMPKNDQPCGNEFFMDDYEVNALMSVLRSEMSEYPVKS